MLTYLKLQLLQAKNENDYLKKNMTSEKNENSWKENSQNERIKTLELNLKKLIDEHKGKTFLQN